ncbi:MAG: DUF1952 domain-containing protein [Anaerolineae bacterium]
MPTIIREICGIPFFLLKEYLQELGGTLVEEDLVAGDGWRVRLERIAPFRLGSLEVGQTRLTMELEDEKAEDFLQRFALKTLRAGA